MSEKETFSRPDGKLRGLCSYLGLVTRSSAYEGVVVFGLLIVSQLATVAAPAVFGRAIDELTQSVAAASPSVTELILAYGGLRFLSVVANELRSVTLQKTAHNTVTTLAVSTFLKLFELPYSFYVNRPAAHTIGLVNKGLMATESILTYSFFYIAPTVLAVCFSCSAIAFLYGEKYVAVIAITILAYIAYTACRGPQGAANRREFNKADNNALTKLSEGILNYETIALYGREKNEASLYESLLAHRTKAGLRSVLSFSIINLGQALIVFTGMVTVLLISANDIRSGSMSMGGLVALNTYLLQLAGLLVNLGYIYSTLRQSLVDVEPLRNLHAQSSPAHDISKSYDKPFESVRFRGVGFRNANNLEILDGVDFDILPKKTLGIVGASGSGKTTLVRLLMRQFDPSSGHIYYNSRDVQSIEPRFIRRRVSIVPQDVHLFNETIRHNITYGSSGVTPEDFHLACKVAKVDGIAEKLPHGYDTVVGDRAQGLSHGERQRLAIARALVSNAEVLVFDEATSALDSTMEQDIWNSIGDFYADTARIIIAHRLIAVKDADEIIVLEKGKIAERGSHAELIVGCGRYAAMWNRQMRETVFDN